LNELDQRILICQRILAQKPNSTLFASLADAYRKKGILDKAFKVCESGLMIHPHYRLGHLVMAKILLDMNLLDEAEYEVELVSGSGLPQATVGLLKANLLLKRGRIGQAKEILKGLSLYQPDNEQVDALLRVAEEKARQERKGGRLMSEIIDSLYRDPGVKGVVLVDKEGLVFGGNLEEGRPEELGVAGAAIYNSGSNGMMRMKFGKAHQIELSTTSHKFWLFNASFGYLVLLTEKEISPGSLKLKAAKAIEALKGG